MRLPRLPFPDLRTVLRTESPALLLFGATVWILVHRYTGIRHDGIFYAGQAIYRLDPTPFAKDLFFAYGSQDNFTAFTSIYALGIRILGLADASALLLGLAHLVWFLAAAWLLRALVSGFWFWIGLIQVTTLPPLYGAQSLLSYGESFLTARSWAEPFSLLAVAFILRGQRLAAVTSVGLAAAMHPMIAFPAALLVFFLGTPTTALFRLCLAGMACLSLLIWADIGPFHRLVQTMDPEWLQLSMERSPFTFLALWEAKEFKEPLFVALMLATSALGAIRATRRLAWSALAVMAIGMGLAGITVLWPSVLLIQMQPWRVLWLVKVLCIIATVSLVKESWQVSPLSRLLLGALFASLLTLDNLGLICAVPLATMLILHLKRGFQPRLPVWIARSAWAVIALIVAEKVYWILLFTSISLDLTASSFLHLTISDRLFMVATEFGWFFLPLLCAGLWYLLMVRPAIRPLLAGVAGALLINFALHWRHTTTARMEEEQLWNTGIPELTNIITPRHLTYWGNNHPGLWFILHRGSYAAFHQAAGLVFSRQVAIEGRRRLERLNPLGLPDSAFRWGNSREQPTHSEPKKPPGMHALIHACHDPILDFVVLPTPVAGVTPLIQGELHSAGPKYHVYACLPLRTLPDPYKDSN